MASRLPRARSFGCIRDFRLAERYRVAVAEQTRDDDRLTLSPAARQHLVVALWAAAVGSAVWMLFDPMAEFFALGVAACAVVTVPMLRTGYRVVEPWTFLALAIYMGHGVRGFFIALYGADDPDIQTLFLLGRDPDFFTRPGLVYLAALALMAIAYNFRHRNQTDRPQPERVYQFGHQVDVVILATAIVGLVGAWLFMQATGGFSLDVLSAKRTTITGVELTGYQGGYGVYRTISQFSTVAFMLAVARFTVSHGRIPAGTGRWLWLAVLFANVCIVPVHSSTRADVVYPLVGALVVRACLGQSRLKLRTLAQAGAALIALLAVLTFLRATSEGTSGDVTGAAVSDALSETLVLNRNFGELPVTAHIMAAVPEQMDYSHGSTTLNYLLGPVPRSVWPDKPLVSPGPIIGARIYKLERTGVPPGAVGEFYWAFGLPGVLFGSLLFGWLLRVAARRYTPVGGDPRRVLLYASALMPLALNTVAVSLGYALLTAGSALVMMWAALVLAGSRGKVTAAPQRPSVRSGSR